MTDNQDESGMMLCIVGIYRDEKWISWYQVWSLVKDIERQLLSRIHSLAWKPCCSLWCNVMFDRPWPYQYTSSIGGKRVFENGKSCPWNSGKVASREPLTDSWRKGIHPLSICGRGDRKDQSVMVIVMGGWFLDLYFKQTLSFFHLTILLWPTLVFLEGDLYKKLGRLDSGRSHNEYEVGGTTK